MPGCDEEDAFAVAERMRIAVQDLAFLHVRSPFDQRLSISIGSATIVPTQKVTSSFRLGLADEALYQSKQSGRNRTTAAQSLLMGYLAPSPADDVESSAMALDLRSEGG